MDSPVEIRQTKRPLDSYFLDVYLGITAIVPAMAFMWSWYNPHLALLFAVFTAAALTSFLRTRKAFARNRWVAACIFSGASVTLLLYFYGTHERAMFALTLATFAAGIGAGIFLRWLVISRKFITVGLAAVLLLAAMTFALFGYGPIWLDRIDHPFVNKPMPALMLQTPDGQPIDTKSWRGRVVVMTVWATWCGPCKQELSELVRLQEHYKNDPRVLIVAVDVGPSDDDTAEKSHAYLQANHLVLNEAISVSPEPMMQFIQREYDHNAGIPFLLVMDANQRVRVFQSGIHPQLFMAKTTRIVDSML